MGVQGERGFIGTTERAVEAIVCKSGVVYRPAIHDLWSARLTVIFFRKSPDREASRTQEKLDQNVLLLLLLLLHVAVLTQYGDCIHGESERALDPLSLS